MRITSTVACAAALAVSSLALGASSPMTDLTNTSPSIGGGAGPEVSVNENFETFTPGNPVQSGWTTTGTGAGTAFQISTVLPIQGTQSVRFVNTSTTSTAYRYISPVTPVGGSFGYQGATFRYDTLNATTSVGLETVGTGAASIGGRVLLQPSGNIEVLQAVGSPPAGVFTDVGDWVLGVPVELGIEALSDGSQNVYINKSLVFSGLDINFVVGGTIVAPSTARTQAFTGTTVGAVYTTDNFNSVIPEPASLSAVALAGAMALRRRRA